MGGVEKQNYSRYLGIPTKTVYITQISETVYIREGSKIRYLSETGYISAC